MWPWEQEQSSHNYLLHNSTSNTNRLVHIDSPTACRSSCNRQMWSVTEIHRLGQLCSAWPAGHQMCQQSCQSCCGGGDQLLQQPHYVNSVQQALRDSWFYFRSLFSLDRPIPLPVRLFLELFFPMPSMFSLWNPLPFTSCPLPFSNKSQQAFCQSRWHNAINGVEVKPNNVLLLRSLPKLFLSITGVFWHTWQFLILCSDTPDNSWFFEKLQTHRPFIHLQQFRNSYFYYLKYSFKSAFNNVSSIGNSIKFSCSNKAHMDPSGAGPKEEGVSGF